MKTKLIASILLIAAVLFAQVGIVAAAPPAQDPTPITGTIQTIVPEKDANGTTTVVVTFTDAQGATQTVRLSVETAKSLGLLQVNSETGLPLVDETTGLPLVDASKVGTSVTIDPTTVIPEEPVEEEPVHPISALLGDFFGVEGSVIDGYHQNGFGFGVIAQALWMSKNITGNEGGDPELAGCILDAKKNGSYGECFDFGDDPVPTNWGQFKKLYSEKKNNLGSVVSGKADKDTTDPVDQQEHGNGKDKDKDKNKDNGKDKDKDKGNGKNKP